MTTRARPKVVLNWSGGKDSALALHRLQREGIHEVVGLLTTFNDEDGHSSMHHLPKALVERQAAHVGLPLHGIHFDSGLRNYRDRMRAAASAFKAQGIMGMAFGDLASSGTIKYREELLAPSGLRTVLPLGHLSSAQAMEALWRSGIQARIVVVDADVLPASLIGTTLDESCVRSLPKGADPAGEAGEYHTFAFGGGPFLHPVSHAITGSESWSQAINLSNGDTLHKTFIRALIS